MPGTPGASAIAIRSTPGRRAADLELAAAAERAGLAAVWAPSLGEEQLSFCQSVLEATGLVAGTAILPVHLRRADDVAATAAYLHEVSGGRMRLGLGVGQRPAPGQGSGRPRTDVRRFVEDLRHAGRAAPLPPVLLATLGDRMLALAVEVADGAIWEHAARSHVPTQLAAARRPEAFGVVAMAFTAIDDDRASAAAACRHALAPYVRLAAYRAHWSAAGYAEEMAAIEAALGTGDDDRVRTCMHQRWLDDVTIHGPTSVVRDRVQQWHEAGADTVVSLPLATTGDERTAAATAISTLGRGATR